METRQYYRHDKMLRKKASGLQRKAADAMSQHRRLDERLERDGYSESAMLRYYRPFLGTLGSWDEAMVSLHSIERERKSIYLKWRGKPLHAA